MTAPQPISYRDVMCPACSGSLIARYLPAGIAPASVVVPPHILHMDRSTSLGCIIEQSCPGAGATVPVMP